MSSIRSSLIHFACIGVAPLDWSCRRVGATPMQAGLIKLDVVKHQVLILNPFSLQDISCMWRLPIKHMTGEVD